ncbi:MAG: hypothetical protein J6Y48_00795 [Clostridia bacterium]|nr:hypothetical protein [Clostridia bacterium]
MKKTAGIFLLLIMLFVLAFSSAEEATVSFKKLTVSRDSETIDLGKVVVGGGDYQAFEAFLAQLPNLKHVDMFSTKITAQRINELAEMFPDIEFGWTMNIRGHLVRTDDIALSTKHSDTSARHTAADFSVLKYCKNLLALDIGHNAVKDLSFLYDLPQLKILIIVDNQFEDLTPVASLTELEYLEIFYNSVRDISCLTGLTKLIDLNIGFNYIEEISPLESMTWLDRLWITHYWSHNPMNKVDPEVAARLQEALPDTQIDYTAKSSIGNGWRKHPRYDTMRKIFNKNTWIPWDETGSAEQ